jgi:hypothetical protein
MIPPKWLFMYTAYLDETGQDTKEWVFIAGFMGKKEHWEKFIPEWKRGLGPQRKRLHMKELRFKKYRDKELLERLGPIPVNCGLEPVIGGIRVDHYSDLLLGNSFLKKFHCGFLGALMNLTVQVLRWLPGDERVEIIFEQQDRYYGLADFIFSELVRRKSLPMTSDGKPKLAKWSSVPSGSTCLLDPSDYFAFATAHAHKDLNSIKAQWTQPMIESVNTVEAIGRVMNRDEARRTITALLKHMRLENILLPESNEAFEKFRALTNRAAQIPREEREEIERELDKKESGISKVRSDDGGTAESSSQRDQEETG